jgi:hypothetical protein
MACIYSEGIVDLIDERWSQYPYDRGDVIEMIARISRPEPSSSKPISKKEREEVERLLAACD